MMDVLVLRGDGLNCERESASAFERYGARVVIMPVKSLLADPVALLSTRILVLPGGFSYGDEMQSGHILGMALTHALKDVWPEFLKRQGLALGICNGFQTLMKMGVFESERAMALVANRPVGFQNRWVTLNVLPSHCHWTKNLAGESLTLPIRHGEGRVWSETVRMEELVAQGRVPLRYTEDVNGSLGMIAGLTDVTGQVLGLMPHPEAALESWLVPNKSMLASSALNARIFLNALNFIKEVQHA